MSGEHSEYPHGPTQIVNGELARGRDRPVKRSSDGGATSKCPYIRWRSTVPTTTASDEESTGVSKNATYYVVGAIAAVFVYEYGKLFLPYDFGGNKGIRATDKEREKQAAAEAAAAAHDDEEAHGDDHDAEDDADADADADAEEEAEAE